MREIILDTETTGLNDSDKIIEIACHELHHYLPTGRTYHAYINPEMIISAQASEIHGLTNQMLKDKPVFKDIMSDFLAFIGESPLVIHNAAFDVKFINRALKENGGNALTNPIIDTLMLARTQFPGSPASLDALCKRFKIDRSARDKHGALIDCHLLAQVYLELRGGRQQGLILGNNQEKESLVFDLKGYVEQKIFRPPRDFPLTEEERQAHQRFLESL